MISLVSISKTFNVGQPNRFAALKQTDLTLALGQVTVFKGPSGSGKTTILSIVGCMARPTTGRIWIRDREVTRLPERFLASIRRESFGFVFQKFNLIEGVSVLENVILPTYPTGRNRRQMMRRARFLLEVLDIGAKEHEPVQHLSGGEQQRAAIARALINDPEFVVADEPTAHLDTDLAQQFLEIVAQLKADGKTILMGSHDPVLFNSAVVDRVVDMRYGQISREG